MSEARRGGEISIPSGVEIGDKSTPHRVSRTGIGENKELRAS